LILLRKIRSVRVAIISMSQNGGPLRFILCTSVIALLPDFTAVSLGHGATAWLLRYSRARFTISMSRS
jgi:hypothetical protein